MTKEEFLEGLKRALFSTGSQSLIEYNLDYYSSYIDGEIAKGRSMDEVMNELGDPRLIANSIKVAEGYSDVFVGLEDEVIDESTDSYRENQDYEFNNKGFDKDYEDSREENGAFKIYNMTGKSLILAYTCSCRYSGGIFIFGTCTIADNSCAYSDRTYKRNYR